MLWFYATLFFYYFVIVAYSNQISCSNNTLCHSVLGKHSSCNVSSSSSGGSCECSDYYYQQQGPSPACLHCPGIGDSCEQSQCCDQDYLVCHGGVCMCIYSDYCWSVTDTERARFQRVAQGILAVALILTATILFILFWKACTRRTVMRRHLRHLSADSFLSLNSIQRLVLLQLQDRPPPYSHDFHECQPCKTMCTISEPPPSYIEAIGIADQPQGEDNFVFVLGEFPSTTTCESSEERVFPVQNNLSTANNTLISQQGVSLPTSISTDTMQHVGVTSNNSSRTVENNSLSASNTSGAVQNPSNTHLALIQNTELHI